LCLFLRLLFFASSFLVSLGSSFAELSKRAATLFSSALAAINGFNFNANSALTIILYIV